IASCSEMDSRDIFRWDLLPQTKAAEIRKRWERKGYTQKADESSLPAKRGIHRASFSLVESRKECLAVQQGAHGVDQRLPDLILGDESLHRDGLRRFHDVPALVHGEKQDRHLWIQLADLARGFEAAKPRHRNVQDDQVRL